ncbi:ribonuclease H-like domain-containing protein [Tanacetum coccineum]|uniref:Ribonuclease H-like domain-containing protein n=1 Tax=Tanacetum coccineum TaxID=301880 RepID=A0ABQ5A7E2_9ASTR
MESNDDAILYESNLFQRTGIVWKFLIVTNKILQIDLILLLEFSVKEILLKMNSIDHRDIKTEESKTLLEQQTEAVMRSGLQFFNAQYARCSISNGFIQGNLTLDKLRNRSRIRINKWYQSFALRNFDLEVMEFESAQSSSTAKLPILKLAQENGTSVTKMSVPVTAKEKTNKKNDVKARGLLLMAIPNEHQLTFSQYTDAKTMFAAIKTRFGGFRRFTSSTNDVNTVIPAYEVSTTSLNVNTASPQVSTASFSDNFVYAFMVENPNGSNLLQQDLEQIHKDDLEAMDLKWQLSLLSMRAKRYYQETGKKIYINSNDTARFDKSKVECFNYHKMGHFARECRAPRNKEGQFRNQDNTRKQGNNEDTSLRRQLYIPSKGNDGLWEIIYNRSELLLFMRKGLIPIANGKPQQDDTGFIDSGCSRHMTGNIAYLSDFKEFDGGYVTFGGGDIGG